MISQLILSVSFFAGKFLQPLECFLPSILRGSLLLRPKAGSSQSGSYVLYRAMKSLFGLVDTDTYFVMAADGRTMGQLMGKFSFPGSLFGFIADLSKRATRGRAKGSNITSRRCWLLRAFFSLDFMLRVTFNATFTFQSSIFGDIRVIVIYSPISIPYLS